MAKPRAIRPGPTAGSFRLQVWRTTQYAPVRVRTLSDEYKGFMTHWLKSGSRYCPGARECPLCRNDEGQWKGYFPGEVYDRLRSAWVPWVVELTEASELDVRGRFARGQVWQFHCDVPEGKKFGPVVAALCGEVDRSKLRPAFEIWPVLRCLYRVDVFDRLVPNPAPPRVYLQASADQEGIPSDWNSGEGEKPLTAEQLRAAAARTRELLGGHSLNGNGRK